jgi:hypothetical protein
MRAQPVPCNRVSTKLSVASAQCEARRCLEGKNLRAQSGLVDLGLNPHP